MWHLKMMNSYNESADRYTLPLRAALTLSGMLGLATIIVDSRRKAPRNNKLSVFRSP
jgi:hypothetical protein